MKKKLGTIISGSLTEGFVMRIASRCAPRRNQNRKICLHHRKTSHTFFLLITDLSLKLLIQIFCSFPPTQARNIANSFLKQKDIYATAIQNRCSCSTKTMNTCRSKQFRPILPRCMKQIKKMLHLFLAMKLIQAKNILISAAHWI